MKEGSVQIKQLLVSCLGVLVVINSAPHFSYAMPVPLSTRSVVGSVVPRKMSPKCRQFLDEKQQQIRKKIQATSSPEKLSYREPFSKRHDAIIRARTQEQSYYRFRARPRTVLHAKKQKLKDPGVRDLRLLIAFSANDHFAYLLEVSKDLSNTTGSWSVIPSWSEIGEIKNVLEKLQREQNQKNLTSTITTLSNEMVEKTKNNDSSPLIVLNVDALTEDDWSLLGTTKEEFKKNQKISSSLLLRFFNYSKNQTKILEEKRKIRKLHAQDLAYIFTEYEQFLRDTDNVDPGLLKRNFLLREVKNFFRGKNSNPNDAASSSQQYYTLSDFFSNNAQSPAVVPELQAYQIVIQEASKLVPSTLDADAFARSFNMLVGIEDIDGQAARKKIFDRTSKFNEKQFDNYVTDVMSPRGWFDNFRYDGNDFVRFKAFFDPDEAGIKRLSDNIIKYIEKEKKKSPNARTLQSNKLIAEISKFPRDKPLLTIIENKKVGERILDAIVAERELRRTRGQILAELESRVDDALAASRSLSANAIDQVNLLGLGEPIQKPSSKQFNQIVDLLSVYSPGIYSTRLGEAQAVVVNEFLDAVKHLEKTSPFFNNIFNAKEMNKLVVEIRKSCLLPEDY